MQVNIVKKKIDELIPASYNPRKDLQQEDKEYQKIKKSIQEFGYVEPVIYNKTTGIVVGGHQRLKVLKELGYDEIDVVEIEVTNKQEKALNIALNKIEGQWDKTMLKDLLEDLDDGSLDMELTGFDDWEIEQLMTQYHVDEEELDKFFQEEQEPKEKEPKSITCPHCGEEFEA